MTDSPLSNRPGCSSRSPPAWSSSATSSAALAAERPTAAGQHRLFNPNTEVIRAIIWGCAPCLPHGLGEPSAAFGSRAWRTMTTKTMCPVRAHGQRPMPFLAVLQPFCQRPMPFLAQCVRSPFPSLCASHVDIKLSLSLTLSLPHRCLFLRTACEQRGEGRAGTGSVGDLYHGLCGLKCDGGAAAAGSAAARRPAKTFRANRCRPGPRYACGTKEI